MKIQLRTVYLGLALAVSLVSCSHSEKTSSSDSLKTYTKGENVYHGLENNFSFQATIHNLSVTNYLLEKEARFYDWSGLKVQSEQTTVADSRGRESVIFLSFYAPKTSDANLTDANSVWKIYLTIGGERYEPVISKDNRKLTEVQALYPYHTRWSYPYILTFPVPMTQVESQSSQLMITGPLGKKVVEFPSLQTF